MGVKLSNRYLNLRSYFLILFVLVTLADIISTLLVKWKHPIFNESNPLYILGNINIYWLFGLALVLSAYLFYVMFAGYWKIKSPNLRYVLIYFLVLVTFVKLGVVIGNFGALAIPSELIVEVPNEIKLQHYKEQVGDMEAIQNISPYINKEFPLMFSMFFINLIQFAIWRSFELWSWRPKNERRNNTTSGINDLGILEK